MDGYQAQLQAAGRGCCASMASMLGRTYMSVESVPVALTHLYTSMLWQQLPDCRVPMEHRWRS